MRLLMHTFATINSINDIYQIFKTKVNVLI
nr:MAG TPA: calmodulin [Caudoviricetes sp.]